MPSPSRSTMPPVHRQLRSYLDRIGWMARDGWGAFWPRILGVTGLNAFGVLATAAVVLGVAGYAPQLAEGPDAAPRRFLGLEISVSPDGAGMAGSIAALALLGLLGAAALYAAEWQIARIAV